MVTPPSTYTNNSPTLDVGPVNPSFLLVGRSQMVSCHRFCDAVRTRGVNVSYVGPREKVETRDK